jgi:unsaturated chondroitin disaccharide hydrolase
MISMDERKWAEAVAEKIKGKMKWVSKKSQDKIPYTTIYGVHDDKRLLNATSIDDGISWWTNGFWAGIMWLMYLQTNEDSYAEIAHRSEVWLDEALELFYGLHHDVGFMWLPTAVADYRITKDPDARRRGLHAANILAGRFNPVGRFLRAWNDLEGQDTRGYAIIDSMFNLPLLYWAFQETKDYRYLHIATMHADTVMDSFIREDGSSNHIIEFDPIKGGKVKSYGGQGYQEGSAWALYGFAISYRHTHKEAYLDTAKRVARYFIANIPENGIIPVDFRQPSEPYWEDSSAAAIAASGLLEIATFVSDSDRKIYIHAAVKLLNILERSRCNWTEEQDFILNNCTASYHNNVHHQNIIYGDFFFMEAIFKMLGEEFIVW